MGLVSVTSGSRVLVPVLVGPAGPGPGPGPSPGPKRAGDPVGWRLHLGSFKVCYLIKSLWSWLTALWVQTLCKNLSLKVGVCVCLCVCVCECVGGCVCVCGCV